MLLYFIPLGLAHFLILEKNGLNKEICTKDKMNETLHVVDACLQTKQGALEFVDDLMGTHKSFSEFLKDRCSLTPYLDNCMELGLNRSKICLNSIQLAGLSVWQTIDKENVEYLCKHQDTISNLTNLLDKRCSDEGAAAALLKCARIFTEITPFFDLTKVREKCSEINKLENCVVSTLLPYCPGNVIDLTTPVLRNLKNNLCP